MEPGIFSTKDTALAAFLHSKGFEFIRADSTRFPTILWLRDDDSRIQKFVKSYTTGRAVGNIPAFYRSYKRMLNEIKLSKGNR